MWAGAQITHTATLGEVQILWWTLVFQTANGRQSRLQTVKDQERNFQQPWLIVVGDCHDLTGRRLSVDTAVIQNHASSPFGPADISFTSHPLKTMFLAYRLWVWPGLKLFSSPTGLCPMSQQQMHKSQPIPWPFTQPSLRPLVPHHSSACGPWPQTGGSCSPAASPWSSRMTWPLRSRRAAAAACTAPLWSPQTPWISVCHQTECQEFQCQSIKAFSSCIRLAVYSLCCTGCCFYLKYSMLYTYSMCVASTKYNGNHIMLKLCCNSD